MQQLDLFPEELENMEIQRMWDSWYSHEEEYDAGLDGVDYPEDEMDAPEPD